MKTRRKFFKESIALVVTAVAAPILSRCGSDSSSSGSTKTVTQDTDATGESHSITITCSDITSPPESGVTLRSSVSGDHVHNVNITQAQLSSINSGQTVTITSEVSGTHSHTFTVSACA